MCDRDVYIEIERDERRKTAQRKHTPTWYTLNTAVGSTTKQQFSITMLQPSHTNKSPDIHAYIQTNTRTHIQARRRRLKPIRIWNTFVQVQCMFSHWLRRLNIFFCSPWLYLKNKSRAFHSNNNTQQINIYNLHCIRTLYCVWSVHIE